jgi:LysR family transcriptional regulator, transcriptional activator for dmlA
VDNEPPLCDLRLFCNVARRSSFVATAVELGVSATHVSKRVALLEQTLGVKLFTRTTRRVRITDEGETVYRWARKILEDVEEMSQEIASIKGRPHGLLRICTSSRLGRNYVAPALSLLVKQYPELEIWLELLDRRADLISEGFHLDIRVGEVQEPNLIAHKIVESSRILCAAPSYLERRGYPRTLAEVAQHDCLLFREREEVFGVWRLQGPNGPETVKVTGPLASNDTDVVHGWAYEGHGIIMVSFWDAMENLRKGALVHILPDWRQPADVWAVSTARLSSSAKVRVCVDFLKQRFTRGPLALAPRAGLLSRVGEQ